MLRITFFFALFLAPCVAAGQSNGWLKVTSGTALYLDPQQNDWLPAADRQQVPLHTYVITEASTTARLFKETAAVDLPPDAYFFLDDALPKSRVEIVGALARIEASQLPTNVRAPGDAEKPIGLTYGAPIGDAAANADIPNREARERAIDWFLAGERYDAALLSLKRLMTRFPQLYAEYPHVEQLLELYHRLALYGFLFDETERLLDVGASEPFARMVHSWNETATERLRTRE